MTEALRVHGGYGYSKEYTVERLYRDAPFLLIGEGTSEIQKIVIARPAPGAVQGEGGWHNRWTTGSRTPDDPLVALAGGVRERSRDGKARSTEPDFARRTRCTQWNVKELLGHTYRDVDRIDVACWTATRPDARLTIGHVLPFGTPLSREVDAPGVAEALEGGRGTVTRRGAALGEAWDEHVARDARTRRRGRPRTRRGSS